MIQDFKAILQSIRGASVDRPNKATNGTLSGHAAGEPFEKLVYSRLKKVYPQEIFKQYEFLNDLYLRNPKHITAADRKALFESPTAHYLLSRGNSATMNWRPDAVFEEKQNDTADILWHSDGVFNLIDIKTRNLKKKAQAPNIISATKLAQTCALMIDNEEFDTLSITYVELGWFEKDEKLRCKEIYVGELFSAMPSSLYINWAAAMQIQFHVHDLDQTWTGTQKEWAVEYLKMFVNSAKSRAQGMIDKYVTPYLKYIEE